MVAEERRVSTPQGELTYTLVVKPVKNMNLRLHPDGSIWVSVNRRVPKSAADEFVRSRWVWIGGRTRLLAEERPVLVPPSGAEALPILEASLERMFPLVSPLGVARPQLKARFMTSRWGSCHWSKGVIVMNTALAVVPGELLDYVTLHELVHFLHPNHGHGFYGEMDGLLPDWREKRKALRGYRLR